MIIARNPPDAASESESGGFLRLEQLISKALQGVFNNVEVDSKAILRYNVIIIVRQQKRLPSFCVEE